MLSPVFRNVSWVLGGEVVSKFLHVFFIILAANYLGAAGFGLLSSALAFFALFNFLMDMGLYHLSVRDIARDKGKASEISSYTIGLKVLIVFTVYSFVPFLALILGYDFGFVVFLFFIGWSFILDSFVLTFYGFLQAFERLDYVAVGRVLGGVALLFTAVLTAYLGFGVWGMGLAYIASYLLPLAAIAALVYLRLFRFGARFDSKVFARMLSESWPFGLTLFLTNIILSFDIVAVSYILGVYEAGLYSAASKMVLSLTFILAAYNQSVYPVLSRLHKRGREASVVSGFYLLSMLFIGVPMAYLISSNSADILSLFYSPEYKGSAQVLSILVWGIFLSFLASPLHRVLDATGRQRLVFNAVFSACILNVALNIILVPAFGIAGAAYASVISYTVLFLVPAFHIDMMPHIKRKSVIAIVISCLALALACSLVSGYGLSVRLIIPGLSYVLTFWLLGGMREVIPSCRQLGSGEP